MLIKAVFIILCLLLLKRLKYPVSFIGLFGLLLTSSPWMAYLDNYFYLIPLVILLIFTKIISSNYQRAANILLLISAVMFIISVSIIPPQIGEKVRERRTLISKTLNQSVPEKIAVNLAENKLVESLRYRQQLFFQNFDIGNLFFSNHPRERAGMKEIPKLFFATIPFLIIGLFKTKPEKAWFYFGLAVFSFTLPVLLADQTNLAGFLSFFPLICLTTEGLVFVLRSLFRKTSFYV